MEDLIERAKQHIIEYGYKGFADHTVMPALMAEFAKLYHDSEVKKLNIPAVIKSVCIAPKGECDRKPEDVCKECEGCKYLEQTVL